MTWLLLAAGAGLLLWQGRGLLDFQQSLQIKIVAFRVHRVDITGGRVILALRVALDNPTPTVVRITEPYVEVYEGDSLLANSIPLDKVYEIKARARTELNETTLEVSALKLIGTLLQLPQLLKQYQQHGKIGKTLRVRVRTTANGIPATTEQTLAV